MSLSPNSIVTPQTPNAKTCVCTTGNTTYSDTPTNTQVLYTAGAQGARLTRITALARGAVATNPNELQLYRDFDGSGSAKRLFLSKEMSIRAAPSGIAAQPAVDFGYSDLNPLTLAPGEKLYAAIGANNTGIVFNAEGADY